VAAASQLKNERRTITVELLIFSTQSAERQRWIWRSNESQAEMAITKEDLQTFYTTIEGYATKKSESLFFVLNTWCWERVINWKKN
jgi:hypothetical protein